MKAPAKPKASPDPKMAKKQKEAAEAAKKAKDDEKSQKDRERKEKEDARPAKQEAARKKGEEAETKKQGDDARRRIRPRRYIRCCFMAMVFCIISSGPFEISPAYARFSFRHSFHSKFRLEFHTEHNTLSDPMLHIHDFFVLLFAGKEDWCRFDGLDNELVGRTATPSEGVSVISCFNLNGIYAT